MVLRTTASREHTCQLADTGHLYAVVDACGEPAVRRKCAELDNRTVCLYRGGPEEKYAKVAPYLFALDRATLDWLVEQLWTKPWGIFVYSEAGPETVRTQLRRFLKVKNPQGKVLLFRFYDPRILPKFLEASNQQELDSFFGPVQAYGVGAGDGAEFYRRYTTPEA